MKKEKAFIHVLLCRGLTGKASIPINGITSYCSSAPAARTFWPFSIHSGKFTIHMVTNENLRKTELTNN